METTTLLAATIRTHFIQRNADAYIYVVDGIVYTINEETFNKCLEGHYSYLKFEIIESMRDTKVGKCIMIELSKIGELAERLKEQQLLNQLAKITGKETIVVTRQMKELLNKAFDAGYDLYKAQYYNSSEVNTEGDNVPEITFEGWYHRRVIDSTSKEDLLMTNC